MAARNASRLRRADERSVRNGIAVPAEEHPLFDDLAAQRRRRSGRRPRQAARRRSRRVRPEGAQRRTAGAATLLLRTLDHYQKDLLSGNRFKYKIANLPKFVKFSTKLVTFLPK